MKSLLIINVIVFIVQSFFLEMFTLNGVPLADMFMNYFALQPWDGFTTYRGVETSFYAWQLLTYQFMHGGFSHIFFNLFALWMFGSELESRWGGKKFLLYYLLCGIGAGLVQLFISPMLTSVAPTVGASGAIYGLLLAFGLTFPDRSIIMFPFFIPIPAKIFVILFAGLEMVSGIMGNDGVAHFAHIGGALTGFLLLKFGDKLGIFRSFERLFSKKRSYYNNIGEYNSGRERGGAEVYPMKGRPAAVVTPAVPESTPRPAKRPIEVDGEEITQARIDEILDKISASGYQNLSEREKKILLELSKRI